jgi:RNA polymerase sigma-70 factor (ECF subfamily)
MTARGDAAEPSSAGRAPLDDDADDDATQVFERHRPKLAGLAYRLLGRMGEAEDVLQDAFLRWHAARRDEVREPQAFLMTTVTRLALDRLKSARARREEYVGPWLPEPLMTRDDAQGPLDDLEQRELVSLGLMRLLERLSAPERGVFVLREAFDLAYDEIAAILGLEVANCRKLYTRATKHLAADRPRFAPSRDEHRRLLGQFHGAIVRGDVSGLEALLSEGVVAYGDGGGRVRASRKPVIGRARVARLFVGLGAKWPETFAEVELVELNGLPSFLVRPGGVLHAVSIEVEDGRIRNVYDVANPEKLAFLERQLRERGGSAPGGVTR